ncbi:DUF397 domain-containing protein [Streptomyces cavernicola]|uniref:DUF397 domain-containing protein n=1 Tax=Streptomyces cavernicola TaxID=3043613 RepID=A0ABT6SBZ3_9ACTN|nr:DUF397 domain-containing protein [Streptomyces sp. B-S-A6]MDI3405474.1 DUF397 domain-containing protein [Streptomyces sp. B-S-A6]
MASNRIELSTAIWRKSSYSNGDGGACVEVAEAFPGAAPWRKSRYSNGDGGECVEVRDDLPGLVPVRDSKNTEGPVLVFPAGAWASFVRELRGPVD